MDEILRTTGPVEKLLVVGCNTCVAVCLAGGEKEVGILASALRIARRGRGEVKEATLLRVCEREFLEELAPVVAQCDGIVSLACGVGVQALAEAFNDKPVLPGVNTKCMGMPEEQGIWTEKCAGCGNCILDRTGGICPIARCSKSLLNGPCGGSEKGKCEVNPKLIDCAWQLIHDRMKALGRLEELDEILPPKDWSTSRDGGPRRIVREDVRL